MRGKIDCFLACGDVRGVRPLVETLRDSRTVHNINLIMTAAHAGTAVDVPEGCTVMTADSVICSATIREIAVRATAEYVMLLTKPVNVTLGMSATERVLRVADDSDAALVYSDHWSVENGVRCPHPVPDYQEGSVRDVSISVRSCSSIPRCCTAMWRTRRPTTAMPDSTTCVCI